VVEIKKEFFLLFSEMTGGIIIITRLSHPTNVSYVTSQNTVIT